MKLTVLFQYAGFDSDRVALAERQLPALKTECEARGYELIVEVGLEDQICTDTWLRSVRRADLTDATHVVCLGEDVIRCAHYFDVLEALILAKPNELICGQVNHRGALGLKPNVAWYTTVDGLTMLGAVFPMAFLRDFLAWRDTALEDQSMPADNQVNMWAATRKRLIHKPLPAVIDHDLTVKSLAGNQHQTESDSVVRSSLGFDAERDLRDRDWNGETVHLGRTYHGNHWNLVYAVKPRYWDIEAMFQVERHGTKRDALHVMIATPAYVPCENQMAHSRDLVMRDLAQHQIKVSRNTTEGDSLIARGRHCLVHTFLCSPASHLLMWDSDVEALDPTCVRRMLDSEHPIIAGAYPFRDGSGRVVANLLQSDREAGRCDIDNGNLKVAAAGTGFLLISRQAIVRMMKAFPELLYECDLPMMFGSPMWALFDTSFTTNERGRKRYLSEDYTFCHRYREIGGDVHIDTEARFRHWGKMGFEGDVARAFGFVYDEKDKAAE